MRIEIVKIIDRGNALQERLHLLVKARADLLHYTVLDALKVEPHKILTPPKHAYWFTQLMVNPNDYVILYTRAGTNISEKRKDGSMNHFFFWGLPGPLWGDPQESAILLELEAWQAS